MTIQFPERASFIRAAMADESVMPKLIQFLSSLLHRAAELNDLRRVTQPEKLSVFHGLSRPTISLNSYLQRIFKYANCSPSCYVVAYVYLDRFTQMQTELPLNSFNVHRMLITSVMVAAKFMDDRYYNNAYYAKLGGVSTTEMNLLEIDFLFGLGFNLNVTTTTFQTYCSYLQREMMLIQPQLSVAQEPSSLYRVAKLLHLCFNEEESSHQQQQRQLAV